MHPTTVYWNPGFSRWMPAGAAAYCWKRLIRLKPGLPLMDNGTYWNPGFSRWMPAGAAAYC
ncbi:MAG: hypothetical protein ACLFVO_22990, partial [Chloroflexaceae bacterium]